MRHDTGGLSGRDIAYLKWHEGVSWTKIYRKYPDHKPAAVRGAGRRYKKQHPEEFRDTGPSPDSTAFEENGNYAKAQAKSKHIATLPELIAACGVDLAVWRVQKWGVGHKSCEMGAKLVESECGRAQGDDLLILSFDRQSA